MNDSTRESVLMDLQIQTKKEGKFVLRAVEARRGQHLQNSEPTSLPLRRQEPGREVKETLGDGPVRSRRAGAVGVQSKEALSETRRE